MKISHKNLPLIYTEEVYDAIHSGLPVVALESNVITHGFDFPENRSVATQIENAVRKSGSVPATIGIENGQMLIGMTQDDLNRFASTPNIPKVSSRDLSVILAQKSTGATTVASSIVAAELANISFFCSAGIGGVHRGAETTMDISSDLIQFTRSKIAVVCAGAKKIFALKLTMEFLETHCVPIIGYQSNDFPAFYCRTSGISCPHRLDNENEIAEAIEIHWQLGHKNSILITTPTKEEDAIDSDAIENVIAQTLASAEQAGIRGNAITKYIMRAVDKATEGQSSTANKSVLIHTAEVAGFLAAAHAKHRFNKSHSKMIGGN